MEILHRLHCVLGVNTIYRYKKGRLNVPGGKPYSAVGEKEAMMLIYMGEGGGVESR